MGEPRLYAELAEWWPLLSAPGEYLEEAETYRRLLVDSARREVREVLELGSGGGNNASHLKSSFRMTLVDRSPQMLAVSRVLNPELEHVVGDMRSIRLGRTFDAVFVHDAIAYLTTEEDLAATFATAFAHCRPGGVALFVPDYVTETFRPVTDHGGNDGPDRSLRYLGWTWDPDPSDTTIRTDLAYVFHEPDGTAHAELDRHECGLFPRETWLGLIGRAGFEPDRVELPADPWPLGAEAFLGLRPG
jgi:SAM-dependent methyltransferase